MDGGNSNHYFLTLERSTKLYRQLYNISIDLKHTRAVATIVFYLVSASDNKVNL